MKTSSYCLQRSWHRCSATWGTTSRPWKRSSEGGGRLCEDCWLRTAGQPFVRRLIALTDADGNGQLDLEELISVLAIRVRVGAVQVAGVRHAHQASRVQATHKHTESEMIGAFELFDPDKSGSIPVPYFRTTLRSMLPPEVTDDDLEEMLIDGLGGWERVEAEGLFVPMVAAAGPDVPAAPATAPALAAAASASSAHSRSSSHASAAATAAGTARHRSASPVRGRARQGSTGGGPPERKQGSQRREASSEDSDEHAAREGFWSYEHMFVEYKPWLKRLLSL